MPTAAKPSQIGKPAFSCGPGTKTPRWFRKIDPGSVSVCATDGSCSRTAK